MSRSWIDDAACATRPALGWITDASLLPTVVVEEMAAVCAGCRVRVECETYVAGAGVVGGFWAGADRDVIKPELKVELEPGPVVWVQNVLPGCEGLGGVA
jgi:hypothetical protein